MSNKDFRHSNQRLQQVMRQVTGNQDILSVPKREVQDVYIISASRTPTAKVETPIPSDGNFSLNTCSLMDRF